MFNSSSIQSHNAPPYPSSAIHNFPPYYHSGPIYDSFSIHGHHSNNNNVLEFQPPETILNPSPTELQGNLISTSTTFQTKKECCTFFPNNGSKRAAKRDRHTKISTAQGVRDRRVRLSMGIAREFFDLQDKLGFDKASMTLAWLLAHSRHAIQEIAAVKGNGCYPVVPQNAGFCTPHMEDNQYSTEMQLESTSAAACVTRCSQLVSAGTRARSSSVVSKEKRVKARKRARERVREKLCSKLGQQQQEVEINRHGVPFPTQLYTTGIFTGSNTLTAASKPCHHRSSLQSLCVPLHQADRVGLQGAVRMSTARGSLNSPHFCLGTNEEAAPPSVYDAGIKRQDGSTNNAAAKSYQQHRSTSLLQNCRVSRVQDLMVVSDQMSVPRSATFDIPAGPYMGNNAGQTNSNSFSAYGL